MSNYANLTVGQQLLPGDTITSPLGFYVLTFVPTSPGSTTGTSVTVTFTPTGVTKPLFSWGDPATAVKLTDGALLAISTPVTVLAALSGQVLGLYVLDTGEVVVFTRIGGQPFYWSFANASSVLPATAAAVARAQRGID